METIMQEARLSSHEEVMVLVAMLDRQCSGNQSGINELSDYFQCTSMEIMTMTPAIQALLSRGYIKAEEAGERDVRNMSFKICKDVFDAIVENREVNPILLVKAKDFDNIDLCDAVDALVRERKRREINTRELFAMTERLENEHEGMAMVRELKEQVADLQARTWFYEMCHDFKSRFNGGTTDLEETLEDMYDNITEGAMVKRDIMDGCHPLQKNDLMAIKEVNDNSTSLHLTGKGIRFLLGSVADAFIKSHHCADKYEFLKKIDELVDDMPRRPGHWEYRNLLSEMEKMEEACKQFPSVANAMKLVSDAQSRLLYYRLCQNLVDSDTFCVRNLSDVYHQSTEMRVKRELKDKQHILQKQGLMEVESENFFDRAELKLTDKGKELFLEEDMDLFEERVPKENLIDNVNIADKRLFFEPTLERQLNTLKESLQEQNFTNMCERLKASNLPTGIAALFYGMPGTGKTESVKQIARATGRSVMHVDISATKSCWFGESEKIIKAVFTKYRKLCEKSKVKPILLFNEADAVFSKRKDSNSSNVAQTENAIQNIILEEMERLDGILIATTNMAGNLDGAFERRFLFKIRFDKPTTESKKHIWMDKLPRLTDREATQLALAFNFSGGEIDNIVRKATMEEVISGTAPTIEGIMILCNEEKIASKTAKVGF